MRYLLALGSNLGDRFEHLAQAVAALHDVGDIPALSGIYETEPVGYTDQPPFYNLALALESELEPDALLYLLEDLQSALGKQVEFPNGPRTIDIDIVLAEDLELAEPGLTIPHPRMHERLFVLQPLAEVDPLAIHPTFGVTVEYLLSRLDPGDPAPRVIAPDTLRERVLALRA